MATAAHRGQHPKQRARWAPTINAGHGHCHELICLERTRWIQPGSPWDLAHDRRTGGYLGPAHARCNRAEGARYGNRLRAKRPRRLPTW